MTGELSKLPGIGRRTALRLAIHLLRMEPDSVSNMTRSIDRFRRDIKYCKLCNNLSDEEICPICADRERDHTTVCVVEQVADVLSIENTRQYRGLYHVLGGVISPMQGIAPSDLKIDLLIERIAQGTIREVILAISTSVEGETTLFYLLNRLRQYPQVKVTSIARGIGFGDELEYVDELTITHALMNRREIESETRTRKIRTSAKYKATANIRNEYSRLFFHRADISPLIDEMKLIGIESLFFDLVQNPDQHLRR